MDLNFLKKLILPPNQGRGISAKDRDLIDRLQGELRRYKQMSASDHDYMLSKNQQLQRDAVDYLNKQKELQDKIVKLEAQKSRIEEVFKSTMKGGNMDLIDQVQLMVRKVEFMEEQS